MSNIKMDLLKGKIPPPYFTKIDENGQKWYILKDNERIKYKMQSRIIGISSLKTIIKARKVKSGMAGMDFISLNDTKKISIKNKLTNEQINEGGITSSIPYKLINDIFCYFNNETPIFVDDEQQFKKSSDKSFDVNEGQRRKTII
ncbi:hypothetical protein [Mycoplasma sp. SG1]|uniref:hypothetical protein n=1 Tax=Mycoplasma sp. SG1 TaxID=2810348 RepID=UPI002025AB3E|nr:hypothetical protein [Mycoplasma sp. SG1]URM52992.1 hypothetical protein JRW51_01440 [Mycoplasma sp. SG1]